ncbi:MAG: hypothetical protein DMF79_06670 [Acidobacteria bacterium]|nr:MAG: hypothetical protein DMF79_06670 [Acidobacteriota bacterium]
MAHPGAGPDRRRPRRDRQLWIGLLGRPAIFVIWAFVLWGTLVALALAVGVLEVGPREAVVRLLPGRGASAWHYLNAASVLLALTSWTLVAVAVVVSRRGRG